MVSKPHAAEIRLSALVERCRQHVHVVSPNGNERVEMAGFSAQSYLLIEPDDVKALQWVLSILPEYESMKIESDNARTRKRESGNRWGGKS